jgi:hypothetical protein
MSKAGFAKIAAILLPALGFVVGPMDGALGWLYFQRAQIRRSVAAHILGGTGTKNLVLLEFTKEETRTLLRWEHPREFEYNLQMYDVVQTWTVGDTVYFRCFWDRAETKLKDRLRELAALAMGTTRRPAVGADPGLVFVRSSWEPAPAAWIPVAPGLAHSRAFPSSKLYSSVRIPPPTPPPRLA